MATRLDSPIGVWVPHVAMNTAHGARKIKPDLHVPYEDFDDFDDDDDSHRAADQ